MATIGTEYLTLVDRATRLSGEKNNKYRAPAMLVSQTNELLADLPFVDANQGLTHSILQKTGLPTSYWMQLNKGVPSSKSQSVEVKEGTAVRTALGLADCRMPNVNELRKDEMVAALESCAQGMASELFYGTASTPEGLIGLATRYGDLSGGNSQNIISMGGAGSDNSSIWLLGLGRRGVYGVLPEGYGAGTRHEYQGKVPVTDADGNTYMAERDEYYMAGGIAVEDWRYAVRIANIDVSAVLADPTGSSIALINAMIKAMHAVPSLSTAGINFNFYMNRDLRAALDIQSTNKSNAYFTSSEVEGVTRTSFRGIPVRTSDAILSTESVVS